MERFTLYAAGGHTKKILVDLPINKLKTYNGTIDKKVEKITEIDGIITILGWGVSQVRKEIKISVADESDSHIEAVVKRLLRKDGSEFYFGNESRSDCGFKVEFKGEEGKHYRLLLRDGKTISSYEFDMQKVRKLVQKRCV